MLRHSRLPRYIFRFTSRFQLFQHAYDLRLCVPALRHTRFPFLSLKSYSALSGKRGAGQTESQTLKIHTFTAPDDGWSVNSRIIEFPTQLVVIDAQYTLPCAQEVVSYAQTDIDPTTSLKFCLT